MITMIVLGVLCLVGVASLWVVKPTEKVVFVRLGRVVRTALRGGLIFCPIRPITTKVVFPTYQLKLEYEVERPVTRRGWYYPQLKKIQETEDRLAKAGPEEKGRLENILQRERESLEEIKRKKPEGEAEFCESVELDRVTVGVYLRYPSTSEGLQKALEVLGGPRDQNSLQTHYRDFVVGSVRELLGALPWRAVVENREYIARELRRRFSEPGSPFVLAGFSPDEIFVTVSLVDLPDSLAKLLSLPQEESLKAEAAKREAERRAFATVGSVVEMMAKAQGKTLEKVQKEIQKDESQKKVFLELSQDLVKRSIAIEGKSFLDIRVQGAQGLEKALLNLLAAWQRMPRGSQEEKVRETKKKYPPLSPEERRELMKKTEQIIKEVKEKIKE